jgi:cadmium resistance protein CadD (predicted permease)
MEFESSLSPIAVGVALFATTNVDDIFLLAAFFADRHLRPRSVVLGQFLGIGALTALSAAAASASLVVPEGWMALLGLVPLVLGIQKLWHLRLGANEPTNDVEARDQEQLLERRIHSQVFAVAGVTIANGGDNLAVYIPVFATSLQAIPIFIFTFAVMTGLWCVAGFALVNNALLGQHIRRYGHILLPLVLIAIGVWILRGAGALFR